MNAIFEQAAAQTQNGNGHSNGHTNGKGPYSIKDFKSDQDIRWCPGCGDYAILAQMQKVMPDLGIPKEKIVFVSGIGCSSRFPYYMDTYGFHSIHGRAPSLATGLKIARPDLSIWVVTGDGDGLSIGGNHLLHLMRRNVDLNVLLFNNEIYGLTKGQYSPTSAPGLVTKSTPLGSLDHPFNPLSLVIGAEATFVARTMDRDLKHLNSILRRAAAHKGTSFIEIYQNCIVFNDGVFEEFTDKAQRAETSLYLENGRPMIYGAERNKGIRIDGLRATSINLDDGKHSADDVTVFDESDRAMAFVLSRMDSLENMPRAFGVLLAEDRARYEDELIAQIDDARSKRGSGDLQALLETGDVWEVGKS